MLTNYHTHTEFCDGENSAEEMVKTALKKGFSALGFSSHGYTPHDLRYCIKDEIGYIAEINRLKEKYKNKIQIYLGVEEDASEPVKNRESYDYVIGSYHYIKCGGNYMAVDSSEEHFKKLFKAMNSDIIKTADAYFTPFCDYILKRKPDIVGHFDLITKYDELMKTGFMKNSDYLKISEKYLEIALKSDCIFELNTGAIARKCRTTPYPAENLLHFMKKRGGKLILSSDCHFSEGLDFYFSEAKKILKSVGFEYVYALYDNKFEKDWL